MLEWLRSLLQLQVRGRQALPQGNPCSTTSRLHCACEIPQGATRKCSLPPGWATDLIQHQEKVRSPAAKSLVLVQLSSSLQLGRRGRKFPRAGVTASWGPAAGTAMEHRHCSPGALPVPGEGDWSCVCWCHRDGDISWGHFCGRDIA